MGVVWTRDQQKVIDLRNRNILVSAAAGSGKTAVLVERIITLLTAEKDPVSVDHLLIVTFTEAAASEMKERIRAAIEKKLEEEPDNEHLKRQETLIHNAQITTIHSFCLSVIRDHFHTTDLDPGFRIGEEGELQLLRHDVMEKMLEDWYEDESVAFSDFISVYGDMRNDKKLEEYIWKIYEFSRSYPDGNEWLRACRKAYAPDTEQDLDESPFILWIMENARRSFEDALELLKEAIQICLEPDGPLAYESVFSCDEQMVEKFLHAGSYRELSRDIRALKWTRLSPNRKGEVSEEKIKQVKALREEVKTLVEGVVSQFFYQDVQEMLKDIRLCRPMIEVFTGLVEDFDRRFRAAKQEKNMIDFSDMEQYALQILTKKEDGKRVPSKVAEEYQNQFYEIMIDEYQDSNLIQETILTSISSAGKGRYNVFMVGDVKQSIYRFRLSRPELFMEKFDTYTIADSQKQRVDLSKNFRSRREVLESVNFIFRQIMIRELGGVVYDDRAALYVGASYPACEEKQDEAEMFDDQTEVIVIDSQMDRDVKDQIQQGVYVKLSDRELEARAIAGRIRKLMEMHQVIDKQSGEFRPVRYSDIVILTRNVKGTADVFAEVLNREGIPTYTGTREGYFETQEIGVLLDYLRVLGNIRQDIPLAAVLTSAFCGLTEEELATVKGAYKKEPFHRAVFCYMEDGEDKKLQKKLIDCFGKMEGFRRQVPYTPMHELLRKILRDTGYLQFVSAMPCGEQRRANLEMLVEKAKTFESGSYKGLFHFVRYIEQLRKYHVDYGEAMLTDEQSDTVRIMTIHKSKGLEFPVVFVAGMGKRFNMQDTRSPVVFHAAFGVGIDASDPILRTKTPGLLKKVIQKEEALESLGEELRILYVAFTRAKEKLIITGTLANAAGRLEQYEYLKKRKKTELSFTALSRASTAWDFILPALVRQTGDVPMKVEVVRFEDIVTEEISEETTDRIRRAVLENWDASLVYEPSVRQQLEEQFSHRYAYENSRMQKQKFTVSELKKHGALQSVAETETEMQSGEVVYEEQEVVPLLPKFLQEKQELAGAARGTAYHRFLELLDFRKNYTAPMLAEELRRFCDAGKMTDDMADCIRTADILSFLESGVGRRMRACAQEGRLYREQPFVLGVPAGDIYPEEQGEELLLVQGIMDVYFEEEDGLTVLDYKTDHVRTVQELKERYHAQLEYYARALEQLTHKKVKEKVIYSFTLGQSILIS